MKHTPGPWRVGDAGHAVFGPEGSGLNRDAPVTIVQRIANKANSHIIAAAPDLLEALLDVEEHLRLITVNAIDPKDFVVIRNEVCERAQKAIAKALGKS